MKKKFAFRKIVIIISPIEFQFQIMVMIIGKYQNLIYTFSVFILQKYNKELIIGPKAVYLLILLLMTNYVLVLLCSF